MNAVAELTFKQIKAKSSGPQARRVARVLGERKVPELVRTAQPGGRWCPKRLKVDWTKKPPTGRKTQLFVGRVNRCIRDRFFERRHPTKRSDQEIRPKE